MHAKIQHTRPHLLTRRRRRTGRLWAGARQGICPARGGGGRQEAAEGNGESACLVLQRRCRPQQAR